MNHTHGIPKPNRPTYTGSVSMVDAERRLKSCGMQVKVCERWHPEDGTYIWRADTDRGERFVIWDGRAWQIRKEAPCRH